MNMRNFKRGLFLAAISLILFSSLISAEIIISQPESIYNKGDMFEISIDVSSPLKDTNDFLKVNMICGYETI